MKKTMQCTAVSSPVLMLILLFLGSQRASAAYTALYASDGNDGYKFTGNFTVSNLKTSGWNGIVMFAVTVQPNGDITCGTNTLVSGGTYVGYGSWGANVTALKTAPTTVY